MRKLRPKLRTAKIQKYCKSVEKRKLRPWSEFPPRQVRVNCQNGDGGGSWVGDPFLDLGFLCFLPFKESVACFGRFLLSKELSDWVEIQILGYFSACPCFLVPKTARKGRMIEDNDLEIFEMLTFSEGFSLVGLSLKPLPIYGADTAPKKIRTSKCTELII